MNLKGFLRMVMIGIENDIIVFLNVLHFDLFINSSVLIKKIQTSKRAALPDSPKSNKAKQDPCACLL